MYSEAPSSNEVDLILATCTYLGTCLSIFSKSNWSGYRPVYQSVASCVHVPGVDLDLSTGQVAQQQLRESAIKSTTYVGLRTLRTRSVNRKQAAAQQLHPIGDGARADARSSKT